MQMNADKEMTAYNKDVQMQLWRDTSYGAQKEQMEKAGINPGLMYGMGGGGGQTANISSGNVGGGRAAGNTGENVAMAGMGLDLALKQAQIKLMEAQAKKTDVEADVTGGVGKDKIVADTGVSNTVKRLNELNIHVSEETLVDQIKQIVQESQLTMAKKDEVNQNVAFGAETFGVRAEEVAEKVALIIMQKEALKIGIEVDKARIEEIAAKISQGWAELDLEERKTRVAEIRAEYDLNPSWDKLFNTLITSSGKIFDVIGRGRKGPIQSTWKKSNQIQYQKK